MTTTIHIFILISAMTFLPCQQTRDRKPISKTLPHCDGAVISIQYGMERYQRTETDYFYYENGKYKVQAVLRSNSPTAQVDTIFTLGKEQIKKLDQFALNIRNNVMPVNLLGLAGTSGKFSLAINGRTDSLVNKSDYSLILDLLGRQTYR